MTQEEKKQLYLSCSTQREFIKNVEKMRGLNWNDPDVIKHRSEINPQYKMMAEEIFPWHYDFVGILLRDGREDKLFMEKGATPTETERMLSKYEYLRTEIRDGEEVKFYKEKEQDA